MAGWFAASCLIIGLSLLFPMSPGAKSGLRLVLLFYAAGVVVALVVMRDRTPHWFLYVQTAVAIAGGLGVVYVSVTPTGAVTSSISLIAVAAYMGFWMTLPQALSYMSAASVGFLAVLLATGRIPELLIPWALVTALCIGLIASFGTLVAQLQRRLVTDPLTGLLNRSGLMTLIEALGDVGRGIEPRALMVIDLDQFKSINDRQGHLAGDRTLRAFGAALRDVIRPEDIAVRSGGDEFVLILPRTDSTGAEALARRLREATATEWSYGVTLWTGNEGFDTAMARADQQMYAQKTERAARRRPGL